MAERAEAFARPDTSGVETAPLRCTGIKVSRLRCGRMPASSDRPRFVRALRRAMDLGLNLVNVTPAYGNGDSEEAVAEAVGECRHEGVIATKFSHVCSHPRDLRLSLEQSLRRLRTNYLDLFQQHCPLPEFPASEVIGELELLKQEGKIRAVGVANWMEPEWTQLDDPSEWTGCSPAVASVRNALKGVSFISAGRRPG